jgi:hypothetical protein
MLPNFLIIGAPRSGTTWMEKNLREHPDVFMPKTKELHFFDRHYEKGIAYYESFFENGGGRTAVGEATPDYLHGAYSKNDIPALIHAHLPDAKLIVSLRNPVERAYSRYCNAKARFARNVNMNFEQKLADRPEFVREGMYYDQLQRFYARFPRSSILVLLFDELKADPKSFMRRVYEFLGIREDITTGWEFVRVNQAPGSGLLAKSQLLYQVSRVLTRVRAHKTAEYIRQRNSIAPPPMSNETRRLLRDIYYEQNCRLQELVGRDLSHWNDA